jgi:hypothetical protein
MTDDEQIAAFLARKGATKCATGDSALQMTARDWHVATRSSRRVSGEQAAINQRNYVVDAAGVEHCYNGLGEWIY